MLLETVEYQVDKKLKETILWRRNNGRNVRYYEENICNARESR